MNPALLQNAYTNQYPLTSEIKYSSQDRSYPNSSVVTNEYLERRDGLSNSTINQSLALSASTSVLDYNSNHSLHEQPYSSTNSQYLLTPPQSADEASTVNNQSSSAYPYSTLPKATSSNVSNLDWNASTSSWPSTYQGMMTDMRQIRGPQMPHFSPPNHQSPFSYSRGIPMPMDPPTYRPSYFHGDAFPRSLISRNMPIPVPSAFAGSAFPPMPQNTAPEPKTPPFDDTIVTYQMVTSRGQVLKPDILAKFGRGFFEVDQKWTCYRRNYFLVTCSFTFKMHVMDPQIYLQRSSDSNLSDRVTQWAVSITAKTAAATNSESEPRGLVQHTPKRDKATESIPSRHLVVAGPPLGLSTSHGLPHNSFYPSASHVSPCLSASLDPYAHGHSQTIPNSYTFERIQFQRATANNGKRRAQQQYFHLVVNLEANIGRHGGQDEWIIVATRQSAPMVVRGRSPGHYKDSNLRDSQASLDPDGHMGHSGDGHSNYVMPAAGNSHAMSMSWQPTNMRQDTFYGQSYSHRNETPYSSLSPESSSTPASTPAKDEDYPLTRTIMSQTRGLPVGIDRILLSPISDTLNDEQMEYHRSKKRLYEDDGPDGARPFFPALLDQAYHNPSFDFSATGSSQGLHA